VDVDGLKVAMVVATIAMMMAGCDRRVAPFVPADQEPPRPERPVRIPGLEKARPRAQAAPLAARAQESRGEGDISGTLELSDGSAGTGPGVVFVIVRSGAGGPPLAVKRLPAGPFPMEFRVGPSDVMMQGREFAGEMSLAVRLDRDGDPLTRNPEDWTGAAPGPVRPGSSGLSIELAPGG
jgi:hypothetical protein